MARRNDKFKDVYNRTLGVIHALPKGGELPTEAILANRLSASRTTIRAVLAKLAGENIVEWRGRQKLVMRRPRKLDYFFPEETQSVNQIIESAFMQLILDGEIDAGASLNESELARSLHVSTSAVREFLMRFSRNGLVERKPTGGWVMNGFTKKFALELSDVREMFERRSVGIFLQQPAEAACWRHLKKIEEDHRDLLSRVETDFLEFPKLDDAFHRQLNAISDNRFISNFHDMISLIFHYHDRWDKTDEARRNAVAIVQHLDIITALQSRDKAKALRASAIHLAAARKSLLEAVEWN